MRGDVLSSTTQGRRRRRGPAAFCAQVIRQFRRPLRRLVALPLLVLLVISPWLWFAGAMYQACVLAQMIFYGCALLGWGLQRTPLARVKLLSLPFFFCLVNTAPLLAFGNLLIGRRPEDRFARSRPKAGRNLAVDLR